jgi:hypothetical protein
MAEPVDQPQTPAAGERTERPRAAAVVVLVLVAAAFAAGCRTGRGWGRLMGY